MLGNRETMNRKPETSSIRLVLLALVVLIVLAIVLKGCLRIVAIVAAAWCVYGLVRWLIMLRREPWSRLHFKAMQLYSAGQARETVRANEGNSPYDPMMPSCWMAMALCGPSDKAFVEDIMVKTEEEGGDYFGRLLDQYFEDVFPGASRGKLPALMEFLHKMPRSAPQLVIARIIEREYGSKEAARYFAAYALKRAF